MSLHKTAEPTTSAEVSRLQNVGIDGLDVARCTISESVPQQDFGSLNGASLAVHLIGARYGLAPHLATLVVRLAGLGGRP